MGKPLLKVFLRQIKDTKSRFISILLIVALGTGVFCGVKAVGPSMQYSADKFFKANNLMDYRVLSDYGFQEDDIEKLSELDGVESVMPSYYSDVLVNAGETPDVVRLQAIPTAYEDNEKINEVNVVEGRLPEKSGECVVENSTEIKELYKIGDTIEFLAPNDVTDISDILKTTKYTVVGYIESPQYISFDKGVTTVGDGTIFTYMMIMPDDFAYSRYTEVYLKTNISDKYDSSFDEKYADEIEKFSAQIEALGEDRLEVNRDDILAQAKEQLDAAKKKVADEKAKAQAKLDDAKKELDDAQTQISENEQKIKDGEAELEEAAAQIEASKQEIADGEAQLAQAKEDYYNQIASAEAQLDDAEKQYEEGVAEYNEQYDQFQIRKAQAQAQIDAARLQLAQAEAMIDTLNQVIAFLNANSNSPVVSLLDEAEARVESNGNLSNDQKAQIIAMIEDIRSSANENTLARQVVGQLQSESDSLQSEYNSGVEEIADAEAQLAAGEQQLADAKAQLDSAKNQIDQGRAELETQKQEGQAQLDAAEQQLEDGKQQLAEAEQEYADGQAEIESGKKELADAKTKLADGKKEYEDGLKEFKDKFKLAEDEISQKEKEVEELALGQWYIFTRDDNTGYTSFAEDTDRLDGIASIFPVFFFIVAALVCLNTMMRMVEEQRTEIGTFKALGYENKSIIAKYFFYALIASVVGSILGIIVGLVVLPKSIYNAYGSMYKLPYFFVKNNYLVIFIAIIGALLCTCSVAYIVARRELKLNAATLMRPKAPKKGKRILLERIPFIWNKINFNGKVTIRNLARYKGRFIMTVLGVAGCTALILSAYGLKDAISVIVPKQYGEIFNYDIMTTLKVEGSLEDKSSLIAVLDDDKRIESNLLINQTVLDAKEINDKDEVQVRLFVPENINSMTEYIDLRDRTSGDKIPFTKDSVIITEKLAKLLDVGIGDEIEILDDTSTKIDLKVTDIAENYVYNYVYISPDLYKETTGDEIKYNTVISKIADDYKDQEDEIAEDWLTKNDILVVTFTSYATDTFADKIASLNYVVMIMIICGAALAFVVLYNLTNINVAERMREIATIKVLGFTESESANYVYRENIILTVVGILVGLIIGTFLSNYLVSTIEMDIVMFGRDIHGISFVFAAAFTLIFSLLVNLAMYKKINNISMVESLKSIE